MTQAQLFSKGRRPMATADDVEWLTVVLHRQGWVTGRHLSASKPYGKHASERQLRAIAEASNGVIVGGPKGYGLMSEVPVAEAQEAIGRIESQARRMTARSKALRLALNRRSA